MQRFVLPGVILILVLGCTLFTGCDSPEINFDDLTKQDGLYYEKFTREPFSGKVKGQSAGLLRKGKREGIWNFYREDGGLENESSYKGGKLHGPYTSWHENGNKWQEGTYKDDELHGLWTNYDENGSVTSQRTYGSPSSWEANFIANEGMSFDELWLPFKIIQYVMWGGFWFILFPLMLSYLGREAWFAQFYIGVFAVIPAVALFRWLATDYDSFWEGLGYLIWAVVFPGFNAIYCWDWIVAGHSPYVSLFTYSREHFFAIYPIVFACVVLYFFWNTPKKKENLEKEEDPK